MTHLNNDVHQYHPRAGLSQVLYRLVQENELLGLVHHVSVAYHTEIDTRVTSDPLNVTCLECLYRLYPLKSQDLAPSRKSKRTAPIYSFGEFESMGLVYGSDVGRNFLPKKELYKAHNYITEGGSYLMALRVADTRLFEPSTSGFMGSHDYKFDDIYNKSMITRFYAQYIAFLEVSNSLSLTSAEVVEFDEFERLLAKFVSSRVETDLFKSTFKPANFQVGCYFIIDLDYRVQMATYLPFSKVGNFAILSLVRKVSKEYLENGSIEDVWSHFKTHLIVKSWATVNGFLLLALYNLHLHLTDEEIKRHHLRMYEAQKNKNLKTSLIKQEIKELASYYGLVSKSNAVQDWRREKVSPTPINAEIHEKR